MTLQQMREARAAAVAAMRAILDAVAADNRTDLNADEQTKYDEAKARVASLDGAIAREEDLSRVEASLDAPRPAAARGQGTEPGGRADASGRPIRGPEASREFETFGQFMFAVRFNQNDQRLAGLFNEEVGAAGEDPSIAAEMRMDTGSSGGFMVPTQFRTDIMRIEGSTAIVRPRATVIPAGTPPDSAISLPFLNQSGDAPSHIYGGVEVHWIAEGDEKPDAGDPALKELKLEPHEVAGTVTVTDKLLRNWAAAGPFLEGLLRGAVEQSEDYAFLRGSGIGKPLGYLNASGTYVVPRLTAGHIVYKDLVAVLARILMRGGNPVWTASQSVMPELLLLKDDDGRLIFVNSARDGVGGTLLGYPIIWNNRHPALGSKGDIGIADFKNYLIKDGSGPFVAASEHVLFKQNKTVIKIFWNVDGQPWLEAPFKEENGYEVSPFVVLGDPEG